MVLRILSRESFGVLELCHILDTGQPALSHHLKVLTGARLVESRREGTSIYYRRALIASADPIRDMRQALFDSVDSVTLDQSQMARIRDVYEQRHNRAKAFFEKNAHRLRENQDLIAEYPQYEAAVQNLLTDETGKAHEFAVELGPGDSNLLIALSQRFNQVIAIDNSSDMLDKAKHRIADAERTNVTFLPGELADYQGQCQLLVLNMVLHHLAAPARLFQEARERLTEGGRLLIADLCAHQEHWTRETCGDQWLGFDPQELDNWAASAGLTEGQSVYLGLKNGFQVQIRIYHHTPQRVQHKPKTIDQKEREHDRL